MDRDGISLPLNGKAKVIVILYGWTILLQMPPKNIPGMFNGGKGWRSGWLVEDLYVVI